VRRRLTLLVVATTALVLLAFLVPLAVLVRQVAEDRAMGRATDVVQAIVPLVGTSTPTELELAVTGQAVPVSVFLPDGRVLGAPAADSAAVRLARARGQSLTAQTDDGREVVVPVVSGGRTTVVRTLVPEEELTRGVTRAWLVLAGLGLALILLGMLVADRLARTLVAPIADLSAVSHRLARWPAPNCPPARTRPGRPRCARWPAR
jgi:hypothetical protein